MLLKSLGILMLPSLTLYLALKVSSYGFRRLEQIEGMLLFLRYCRAQIHCFRTPLGDIYRGFENEALEQAGFLPVLRESASLAVAIEKARPALYLDEEQLSLLSACAGELGGSFCEEQVAACDYYIGEFEAACGRERQECPRSAKLRRSMVLAGGLMVILVLL